MSVPGRAARADRPARSAPLCPGDRSDRCERAQTATNVQREPPSCHRPPNPASRSPRGRSREQLVRRADPHRASRAVPRAPRPGREPRTIGALRWAARSRRRAVRRRTAARPATHVGRVGELADHAAPTLPLRDHGGAAPGAWWPPRANAAPPRRRAWRGNLDAPVCRCARSGHPGCAAARPLPPRLHAEVQGRAAPPLHTVVRFGQEGIAATRS